LTSRFFKQHFRFLAACGELHASLLGANQYVNNACHVVIMLPTFSKKQWLHVRAIYSIYIYAIDPLLAALAARVWQMTPVVHAKGRVGKLMVF